MTTTAHTIHSCRACAGRLNLLFSDLGTMAVANSYVPNAEAAAKEPRFPLRAMVCDVCRLVQLDTVVDAEGIFSDYAYFSSASTSWLAHAASFCKTISQRLQLDASSLVVEVASNDGYLLSNFVAAGVPCVGIEPAANVAQQAIAKGVPTDICFLNATTARDLVARWGRHANLVVANNVLAHVPDINSFVQGLAVLAGDHGVVSIEAPHLLRMVEGVQFDTIYHEHYAYWSLMAMEHVLGRHGLKAFDVEELPTHGGSLRVLAKAADTSPSAGLQAVRHMEIDQGMLGNLFYQGFDLKVRTVLRQFRLWLAQQQQAGRRIAAYGAAAKGNTFLNAVGVTADDLLAVADKSPGKQGRLLPGSHVPVVSPEAMLALAPDDVLVLPWNIASEVKTQLREAGFSGRIWTAVPEMKEV